MPDVQIRYPEAAFGYAAGQPAGYGEQAAYYDTTTIVTAGDVVVLAGASGGTVAAATGGSAASLCIGIAAENAATGTVVPVVTRGIITAKKDNANAVTAGDALARSVTVGASAVSVHGNAATNISDVVAVLGVSLETKGTTATTVSVYVGKGAG